MILHECIHAGLQMGRIVDQETMVEWKKAREAESCLVEVTRWEGLCPTRFGMEGLAHKTSRVATAALGLFRLYLEVKTQRCH